MLMVRKKSFIIPILAFFEVFIWFIAARKALNTDIDSFLIPIFYSLGYATGTYLGNYLSHRLLKNINTIEVITKKNNKYLINSLRNRGYRISILGLKNTYDTPKDLMIVDVDSKMTNDVVNLIKEIDSDAFILIRDIRMVYNGYIK